MIEYSAIIKTNNEIFMLYNGNGFGKTGIGLAKMGEYMKTIKSSSKLVFDLL